MKKYLIGFLLMSVPAYADEATPNTEALSQRVLQEVNANLQCHAALITLQREVTKLREEIAKLKEGEKPKP